MFKLAFRAIVFSIALFSFQQAFAGAYIQEKGKLYTGEGFYYSSPFKSGFDGTLAGTTAIADANYAFNNRSYRISQTSDLRYGFAKNWEIGAKFDLGYLHSDYSVAVDNGIESTALDFRLDYFVVNPEIYIQRKLLEDKYGVLSLELGYLPGELVFARHGNYHKWQEGAYRLALLRAFNWESALYIFDKKKRVHYIELEIAASHYYNLNRITWEFNPLIAVRPGKNLIITTQLYNTFNAISFSKLPIPKSSITQRVNAIDFLDDGQKSELIDILFKDSQTTSTQNTSSKLDLKVGYEFGNNRTLNIEAITEVFSSNSFKDSAILISYEVIH